MSKKFKILLPLFLIILLLFIYIPSISNATVSSEQILTETNGSIDYILSGLTLDSTKEYEWAVEQTQNATISNWYSVTNPDYTAGKIRISINALGIGHQVDVLKATDTAYVTLREKNATSYLLTDFQVDLTLPLMKAYTVKKSIFYGGTVSSTPAFEISAPYGLYSNHVQFLWEKIEDSNIINGYIDNNRDLSTLNLKGRDDFPSSTNTNWKHGVTIKMGDLPETDGLYYLWLQGSMTGVKTVLGQAVIEVGDVVRVNGSETKTDGGTSSNSNSGNGDTSSNSSSTAGTNNGETSSSTTTKETTPATSNGNSTTGKTDPTVATSILPNTGLGITLLIVTLLVLSGGIYAYTKIKKLKDV